jgi:thioredoxin-like negative regulator of GroEL
MVSTARIQQFTDDKPPAAEISGEKKACILFEADWHEACVSGGVMDQVLTELAATEAADTVAFGRVNVENCPGLAQQYQVTAVPTFVLLNQAGDVAERVVGGDDTAKVKAAVQRLTTDARTASSGMVLNKWSRYARVPCKDVAYFRSAKLSLSHSLLTARLIIAEF